MLKMTEVLSELRILFPDDDDATTRFFAAALIQEDKGNHEKADSYLERAIAAEEAAKTA